MVLLSNLETAYNDQQNSFQTQDKGIERVMQNKPGLTGLVDIISEIKRCGNSTYMSQPATLTEGNISFLYFQPQGFLLERGKYTVICTPCPSTFCRPVLSQNATFKTYYCVMCMFQFLLKEKLPGFATFRFFFTHHRYF